MNSKTIALLAAFGCSLAGTAHAEEPSQKGFYIFGGLSLNSNALGYDNEYSNSGTSFTSTSITTHDQSGTGYQLGVGYQFSESSALEIIALRAPKTRRTYESTNTDLTTGTVTTFSDEYDIQDTSIALTWVYGVPVNQYLNPYARAGVTLTLSESEGRNLSGTNTSTNQGDSFNTGYLVGLGNDLYLSDERKAALRTEMMIRTNDGTYGSGSLSLATGMVWKF